MQLDVKLVAKQTTAEREALRALSLAVYPPVASAADAAQKATAWARPEWGVTVRDGAEALVGYVGIVARRDARRAGGARRRDRRR